MDLYFSVPCSVSRAGRLTGGLVKMETALANRWKLDGDDETPLSTPATLLKDSSD